MDIGKRRLSIVAAILAVVIAAGCESDEFAEAEAVTAGEAGQAQQHDDHQQYHDPDEAPAQGQAYDSPGPVDRGAERPPDHPTMQDGQQPQMGGGQQGGQMGAAAPDADRPSPEEYGESGPVRWEAPSDWEPKPPSNDMRFAEYEVGAEAGQPAELTVFSFPADRMDLDETIDRWAGEFGDGPDAERDELDADGTAVHTVAAEGTYAPSIPMGDETGPREDQKLLGAIVEVAGELMMFRLVGDRDVVAGQTDQFDAFVQSFETSN